MKLKFSQVEENFVTQNNFFTELLSWHLKKYYNQKSIIKIQKLKNRDSALIYYGTTPGRTHI